MSAERRVFTKGRVRYLKEKKKLSKVRKKGIAALVLFSTALLLLLAVNVSVAAANWYTEHIYRFLVNTIGRVSGFFPVSLSELCLYLLIIWLVTSLICILVKAARRKFQKRHAANAAVSLALLASVLFLLYTVNCGLNYHRTSFSEASGIQTRPFTVAELKEVCLRLTEYVNEYSTSVERDEQGIAVLDAEVDKRAAKAMKELGETYPKLEGYYPQPKGLLVSELLSYQSVSGIYSPFTIEANYNRAMVPYNIPFTTCHELSHLRGFMQEEEANFIAYLACINSDQADFRYSGSMLGWIYCMNLLWKTAPQEHETVRALLNPQADADLQANQAFWDQYEGPISEVANKVNDTYLKANGQNDGVESYDRMVDLIVAYELG